MGPYWFLWVVKGSFGSLCPGLYGSWFLWVLIGSYGSLWVLMVP